VELKQGATVNLEGGDKAHIDKELGRGGQGIVYLVKINGKNFALKWFTCKFANKPAFMKNMRNNIAAGAPNDKFLWPLYMSEEQDGSFGYVMDLRPKAYAEFSDILNNTARFPSTELAIKSALNIVDGFRKLHQKGFSYQDLNDGNFFINVNNGEALICDNDNVTGGAQKNPGNIGGKPGYMAPEIVAGKAHPSANTDYHSLAVILFKLFIRHDPLMGEAYVKSVCITEQREVELYGTQPVFIFDPKNNSNRPVPGVHPNPIKLWPLYPAFFQEAFIKSFGEGLTHQDARLTDADWQRTLVQLRDQLLLCHCGKSDLYLGGKQGDSFEFKDCGHSFAYPYRLETGKYSVPLFPGKKLYVCHTIAGKEDWETVTGEVITNKNNPALWGIKNQSQDTWFFTPPTGGDGKQVAPDGVIPIGNGVTVRFNNLDGKIVK
jgi:serine/threonine protein kinase